MADALQHYKSRKTFSSIWQHTLNTHSTTNYSNAPQQPKTNSAPLEAWSTSVVVTGYEALHVLAGCVCVCWLCIICVFFSHEGFGSAFKYLVCVWFEFCKCRVCVGILMKISANWRAFRFFAPYDILLCRLKSYWMPFMRTEAETEIKPAVNCGVRNCSATTFRSICSLLYEVE